MADDTTIPPAEETTQPPAPDTTTAPPAPTPPPPAPVPPPPAPQAAAPGTVTLSQEAFDALMGRLTSLEKTSDLVLQVQDSNKIKKIEEMRREGKLVKSVKLRRMDGKLVLAWRTIENDVYKDEAGRYIEKQTLELTFEDDSKESVSLRKWASVAEYVPFEVIGENRNANGDIFFKVQGADGKELEIDINFVN
jgi:hypothetical protein